MGQPSFGIFDMRDEITAAAHDHDHDQDQEEHEHEEERPQDTATATATPAEVLAAIQLPSASSSSPACGSDARARGACHLVDERLPAAVLAHLANSFLDDIDAASLGCANVALLHALRSSYDLKAELKLEEYRHVTQSRSLSCLGRITLGTARRVYITGRDEWLKLMDDTDKSTQPCRIRHATITSELLFGPGKVEAASTSSSTAATPLWRWPSTLQSIYVIASALRSGIRLVDFSHLPRRLLKIEGALGLRIRHTHLANFTELRELSIGSIDCAYADLQFSSELTSLKFGGCTSGDIADLRLPESLTSLSFSNEFDLPLNGVLWPPCLEDLHLGAKFDQPLDEVRLPHSLCVLRFGYWWNQPVDKVAWPPHLRTLEFGGRFNQPLASLVLPRHLTRLCLGGGIGNHSLAALKLPDSLRHLELPTYSQGDLFKLPPLPSGLTHLRAQSFNQGSLDDVEWPAGLLVLELPEYAHFMRRVNLPTTLRRLSLGGEASLKGPSEFHYPASSSLTHLEITRYDTTNGPAFPPHLRCLILGDIVGSMAELQLPLELEDLMFGMYCNKAVDSLRLPESLRSLTFGDGFGMSLRGLYLPHGLQRIHLGRNWNRPLIGVVWPQQLISLHLGGIFHHPISDVAWPPSLVYLDLGKEFNQPLDDVRLPDSLQILKLGPKLKQSLAGFRLPACLARLVMPQFGRARMPEDIWRADQQGKPGKQPRIVLIKLP